MAQSDIEHPGWRLKIWPRRLARAREAPAVALAPYHALNRNWLKKIFGLSFLMLFCLIYGFFFSAFAPAYFVIFASPLAILLLLVIWALPDLNWAPTRLLGGTFYATFIALIVWPNYLAIALPGLPWITFVRLTSTPLVILLLICISISSEFRSTLHRSLHAIPAIPILLAIFVVIQLYSIGLSKDISSSIQKFIVAQTTWTVVFVAGTYVFLRPGEIRRWAMVLWAMAVFVSLIAIWEFRLGHVLWLGHIPGFLKINDEAVQAILAGNMRAGTNLYRAQATFSTPLGLAEYLALTLPFVLHFTTRRFANRIRAAAMLSIPVILYGCYLTNAKLGMIGSLIGILLYVFAASFQSWRRNKQSLVAASVLLSYPLSVALLAAAMFASHRFSVMILGNDGSHAASTAARALQFATGWQKFLQWPFGYGIGMGGATLGMGQDLGYITIDSYYLSVLLEYGIAGFIVYYGLFLIAIFEPARRSLFAMKENEDRSFLLPIGISLAAFVVIKSVFSQQDNHPVVFMMLGALMAIVASNRPPTDHTATARSKSATASRILRARRPAAVGNG
jgi:hypothetical protein